MAERRRSTPAEVTPGTPTVIVSHLDIKYAVYGGERRGNPSEQGEATSLRDLLRASRPAQRTREVHAVKDVSFVARHGESIGIIGRNGSGKSTLLRAVAGLIPPSHGRIWVAGEPSLLGVNAVLKRKLSGERNIYIGAQALGLSKEEIAERFDEIVEFSGIGDSVYLPMSTYSSGMGARLRFAISTAAAPDVLMIDEALATGDADFRAKSAQRIADIREQAGTVFLVSHSNSTIRQICDRVLWLDRGVLRMDGPTEEVLAAYEATAPKKSGDAPPPDDPDVPGTVRWTGGNRFEIAAEVSRGTWEPGVPGCFVVSVQQLAAARSVVPVAARLGWPVLWVRPSRLPDATRDELARLHPQRVVVVGGDEAVGPDALAQLEAAVDVELERVGDDDEALVSAELLRAFPPQDGSTVHVTHSRSPGRAAYSLEAAVARQALVICDADGALDELVSALTDLRPGRLTFHGDAEEWASPTVATLQAATGAEVEFTPRQAPMTMAATLWEDTAPGGEVVVSGRAAVEMLSAVVAAVHRDAPFMFFSADRMPDAVRESLARLRPRRITLVGTLDALPPALRQELGGVIDPSAGTSSPQG